MTSSTEQSLAPEPVPAPQEITGNRSLGVCIVNWRTAGLTIDCLRSFMTEFLQQPNWHVYVVDNDSRDGSFERIELAVLEHGWQSSVTVLQAGRNGGFAAGNNAAIRAMAASGAGLPDYVLLLNPDTVVRPGAFEILINFLEMHPEVGIAGGRSEDPDATPQLCCFRFPSLISEVALYLGFGPFDRLAARWLTRMGIPATPTEVGWVSGAVMMIRRPVLEGIGVMDESYFLYYEETDFTLRAQRRGWKCWHVPESRVVHLVGQSSGVTRREGKPARVPRYWFESRRRYFVLNHGRLYAAATDLLVVFALCFSGLRALLQKGKGRNPPHFRRDFIRYSALLNRNRSLPPRQVQL